MTHIAPQPAFHKAEDTTTSTDHVSHRRRRRSKPLGGSLSGLRHDRLVRHLHQLGPKPVSEFLKELVGNDDGLQADALFLLEKYGSLDADLVRALDADTFAPTIFSVKAP